MIRDLSQGYICYKDIPQGLAGVGKGEPHFIADDQRMLVKINSIFRGSGYVTRTRDLLRGYVTGHQAHFGPHDKKTPGQFNLFQGRFP